MADIGIIINPYSKRIKGMRDPAGYYKGIGGDSADIRLTRNMNDVIKAARDFKRQNISYLAISGGDGSIHHVISRFINIYKNKKLPYVLILRDGSMNNIAKSYSLKGRGGELLKKLVNSINSNKEIDIVFRNTIKVDDMYCFLFGLGFVASYINEFNRGDKKSPLKAVKIMLKSIFSIFRNNMGLLKKITLRLIVDGRELRINKYFAVYAATVHTLALSFNPTPRAYERDNSFHLIATGMRPGEILIRLNKIRKGKPVNHPDHFDGIASVLKIIHAGEFIYQMDGDIYKARDELVVETGPRIGFVKI